MHDVLTRSEKLAEWEVYNDKLSGVVESLSKTMTASPHYDLADQLTAIHTTTPLSAKYNYQQLSTTPTLYFIT